MKPSSIAVLGLGLMGGSLAAACRKKFRKARILGVSRNRQALSKALKKGWIHEASTDPAPAAACDLAVLCTPVDTLRDSLLALEKNASRPVLVTDIGSVKGEIARFADSRSWKHVRFVGAHPMVGSHKQGIDASDPHLYEGGLIFVTPGRRSQPEAKRRISAFWEELSPHIVKTSPERHDEIVGEISHLPHAAAACLMLAIDSRNIRFAGSGFRDATRIAAAHPSVWVPIFLSNGKALTKHLARFEKTVRQFRELIQEKDEAALRKALTLSSGLRAEI